MKLRAQFGHSQQNDLLLTQFEKKIEAFVSHTGNQIYHLHR